MAGDPGFDIPERPVRRFSAAGDLAYDGGTRFDLDPHAPPDAGIQALVETVLTDGPYRYGNFHDLPMPLYLVRDDDTGDVFRVAVRAGTVRLHVLPATGSDGLQAFYERLGDATNVPWSVARSVED